MIHDEMIETLAFTPDQLFYLNALVTEESWQTGNKTASELKILSERAIKTLGEKQLAAKRETLVLELANEVMDDLDKMPHFCKWVRDSGPHGDRVEEVDRVVAWQVAHVIQCPAVSEEDYEEVLHEVTYQVVKMIRNGRKP